MELFENLLRWAADRGVELSGLQPRIIPGRGSAFVANQEIQIAGDTLLTIPIRTVRSFHNIPKSITRKLPKKISLHALLATQLSMDESDEFESWNAAFPTLGSFEASIPMMWPSELQRLLPLAVENLLKKQQDNFRRNWAAVSKAFPKITHDKYLHSWLLVNTRSFYLTTPRMERFPHDDRLALLPVADLFNHSDIGCESEYTSEGYKIIAKCAYHANEEVHLCYGTHSNDFLLAEYGFLLSKNCWDTVSLDGIVLPYLNKKQKDKLRGNGYLGNYTLEAEGNVCFRTQVALRILCCTHEQWQQFVDTAYEDDTSGYKASILLIQLLNDFTNTIHRTLEDIKKLEVGLVSQKEILTHRWKQIEMIISRSIERLKDNE